MIRDLVLRLIRLIRDISAIAPTGYQPHAVLTRHGLRIVALATLDIHSRRGPHPD